MGNKTKIEWTRGDDGTLGATWNPVRGCSRVSPGCENCYAEAVAARFSDQGQPYVGLARRGQNGGHWTGKVVMVEKHLADPLRWKKPRRIFVNSMSDLFHESLSNEQTDVPTAATPQRRRPGRVASGFAGEGVPTMIREGSSARWATFSDDRRYRHELAIRWDYSTPLERWP